VKLTRPYDQEVHECAICHAHVHELRRGRCWGCYARWTEARPVGLGARCTLCGEQRQPLLRSIELLGGWRPMCFNCNGQVAQLDPMPRTILGLRTALSRDRRKRDRRDSRPDPRPAADRRERRVGARRTTGREAAVDDDMVIEITIDVGSEPVEPAEDFDQLTQIRELVRDLRTGERAR
jgi:hypothetical protein